MYIASYTFLLCPRVLYPFSWSNSILGSSPTSAGMEDHFEVMAALISVASKWKHIGGALGISRDTLNAIKKNCGTDQLEVLSQLVSKWLERSYNTERFGKPCWYSLVRAVAHDAGGASEVQAMEIARSHPEKPLGFTTEGGFAVSPLHYHSMSLKHITGGHYLGPFSGRIIMRVIVRCALFGVKASIGHFRRFHLGIFAWRGGGKLSARGGGHTFCTFVWRMWLK